MKIGNNFVKEYWGEGSNRAKNWQRYDMGGAKHLSSKKVSTAMCHTLER